MADPFMNTNLFIDIFWTLKNYLVCCGLSYHHGPERRAELVVDDDHLIYFGCQEQEGQEKVVASQAVDPAGDEI